MADALRRLSAQQREKVETFQSVTGVADVQQSLAFLQSSDWDVTRAVELFFAAGDAAGGGMAAPAPPAGQGAHGPPGQNGDDGNVLDMVGRIVGGVVPQTPLQGATRNNGAAFVQYFDGRYGNRHPKFHENTFNDAMNQAKRQHKFLVVYIHSRRHIDTDDFCRSVLTNDTLSTYIDENFVMWAGDISAAEAMEVSNALRVTTYPSIAVLSHQGQTLEVLEGYDSATVTPESVQEKLQHVVEEHGTVLVAARIEQEERAMERQIREEQDREFQETLARDQAREAEKRAKEEEERKAKEEEEERQRKIEREKEEKKRLKENKKATLPDEPDPATTETATIMFRLPDGSKVTRRFRADDRFEHVFNFVETLDFEEEHYELLQTFPNRVFSDPHESLRDGGMVPQGMLFVNEL